MVFVVFGLLVEHQLLHFEDLCAQRVGVGNFGLGSENSLWNDFQLLSKIGRPGLVRCELPQRGIPV